MEEIWVKTGSSNDFFDAGFTENVSAVWMMTNSYLTAHRTGIDPKMESFFYERLA